MRRPGWLPEAGLLAGWIALGAVGSALANWALPLPADDPLRGTLVVIPLVLAGLAAVGRMAGRGGPSGVEGPGGEDRSAGGAQTRPLGSDSCAPSSLDLAAGAQAHREGPRATAAELAALAALVLLALARPALGLPFSPEVLAAGFLLLLAERVGRQVVALRPLLQEDGADRLPRRPSAAFFLLPLVVYGALIPWSTAHRQPDGDEPWYLLITHSLAYDFDARLSDDYAGEDWRHFMRRPLEPQPGDPVGPDGEVYSRHNELLPLALVPAYRLAGMLGALATMAALSAALAWMTLRLARHYVAERPGEALAAWALAAFAPPLLLYSYQVWVEVPAALLLAVGLDHALERDGRRPWTWREWAGFGLPVLLLPLLKIRFMLISAPLLALGWWRDRRRKPILLLTVALGALGLGILAFNQVAYGNPLKIHTWEEVAPRGYTVADYLEGGLGLFWDSAFGLFGAAPLWLLLVPAALLPLARRGEGGGGDLRGGRAALLHLAALTLPYLVIVARRAEWYGGWSPPFRYPLLTLPLLAILLVPLFARRGQGDRPGATALIAALGALTLALAVLWVAVPGWTYNFAHGRTYLFDLLAGRTGLDVARLFPSSVRPRLATWLWPALASLAVTALWWWPARRERAGRVPRIGRIDPVGRAGALGVAALLALAALVPLAAARVPTRVVELEDPQVEKSGGHPHPDDWVIERTRFRGSWVLRVAERLEAPVVPGGERVRIFLDTEFVENQPVPFALDLLAGDRHLATWTPREARAWKRLAFGPFDWPAGEPLVLRARGEHPPGELNGVVLDRVVLRWE